MCFGPSNLESRAETGERNRGRNGLSTKSYKWQSADQHVILRVVKDKHI